MFLDTCVQVQVPLPHMSLPDADGSIIMVYNCKRNVDFFIAKDKCPASYAIFQVAPVFAYLY